MGNASQSHSSIYSPYGGLGNGIANQLQRGQFGPLNKYLGFDYNAKDATKLANANGPLADYIKQVQGFAPGVFGQAQNAGNQVAQQGQQSYNQLKDQVSQSLGNNANYTNLANQNVQDAFSPIRQSALFQQTSNNVLDPLRASQAARGLESSGAGQAQEQNVLQQLGLQFANNQLGQQQSALQNASQISQAGTGIAQQGLQGVGQLGQYLSAQFGIPAQALQGLLGLLQGGTQGGLQLGQITAPQLGQTASSHKGLGELFTYPGA